MTAQNPIERAQAAARERLGSMSPRERGVEKTKAALTWLYRWGWSSPTLIDRIGGNKSGGLCARLLKAGLVQRERTAAGGVALDVPVWIITLTPLGLQEIERFERQLVMYEPEIVRVRQEQIRHDYLVQLETIKRLDRGEIHGFNTPLQLRARSEDGVKQPDAIWLTPENCRVAVEMELTAKWGRHFDQFIVRLLRGVRLNQEANNLFDSVLILSDSPALLERYEAALQPGNTVQIWTQTKDRKWVEQRMSKVPIYNTDLIEFELLKP
ncbi:hypothetical protein DF105_29160 [Burkholderia stagnalis]|nr:hypothetical protein DF117_22380 [Burkholderia stagnalis]RQY91714.1 hypothetical protein DF106_28645 [Burkholderia stagnalis]RQY99553.1 hypothetical protein DF105_29160 [Burkholderia stagnalis]